MKFIAHRGNINGKDLSRENQPEYIKEAINQGFDVEVDVYLINNQLFLGHDTPQFKVKIDFFLEYSKYLWIHTKNFEAFDFLFHNYPNLHYFYHTSEDFILTSLKFIWVYPNKPLFSSGSVCVMPEKANYKLEELKRCYAICSDNVEYYKKLLENVTN